MAPLLILIGVPALVILVLAIPVDIEFSAAIHGRAEARTRFRLLFGLISFHIGGRTGGQARGKTGGDGGQLLKKLLDAARVEGIWPESWDLAKRLVSCINMKRLAADLTVSLGDDYYTGMLAGLAIPLVLYLDGRFGGGVSLRPAFEEDLILQGDLFAGFSLCPLRIIVPCLVFACSPGYRRVKRILDGGR